jgi:nucleoside 2-deoxyribosyltransferase
MNDAVTAMAARGVTCLWPKGKALPDPKAMPVEEARAALLEYLKDIDAADSLYVFNRGGYLGRSMLVDIGYAYAKGKPVYSLEAIDDEFLSHMVTASASTEDLPQLLS